MEESATQLKPIQSTFQDLLSDSLKLVFLNLKLFIPLIVLVFLILVGISFGTLPLVMPFLSKLIEFQEGFFDYLILGGIAFILLPIVFLTIELAFILPLMKASSKRLKNEETSIIECIGYTFSHIWDAVYTTLNMFWYVFKVILLTSIPILILYVVLSTVGGNSSSFQGLIARNPSPSGAFLSEVASSDAIVSGSGGFLTESSSPDATLDSTVSENSSFLTLGNFILGILGTITMIVGMIWGGIRAVKSSLSLYAMLEEDISGKEALNQSVSVVKGNFGKVVWYISLISILGSIITFIFQRIFSLLDFDSSALATIFGVLSIFMSAIILATYIVFLNSLYNSLSSQHTALENP